MSKTPTSICTNFSVEPVLTVIIIFALSSLSFSNCPVSSVSSSSLNNSDSSNGAPNS